MLKEVQKLTGKVTCLQSYQAFFTIPTLSTLSYSALSSALREPVLLAITRDHQSLHKSLLNSSDWASINTTTSSLCWGRHSVPKAGGAAAVELQVELCAKRPELPIFWDLCPSQVTGHSERYSRSQWPPDLPAFRLSGYKSPGVPLSGVPPWRHWYFAN